MTQDKFTLKWKYFIPNLSSSLCDAFKETNYSDVTLVSDDKKEFQAHKYVLTASSPVLKHILLNNPHPHPIIFLRGVKQQELESILHFIYFGEVSFYNSNMTRFIEAAKDLQIKQLTDTVMKVKQSSADHLESDNNDAPNQDIHANTEYNAEYNNCERSISSTANKIVNINSPLYEQSNR